MTTKHTPGPWTTYIEDVVYAGSRKIADCDSSSFAERPLPADDEDKANARLISAAPDLLDTLEFIANCAKSGPVLMSKGVANVCAEAIAKARG